ncbi:hypothetical protein [Alkalicoccus halolimnae]|uniref:AAA family ATPase n=1 Tax=Alkalicoccus halolimnae TaxID=1667239 RepID=A0A5C7F4A8_9BACI|nr:hypothetical protein [Alkalicoccus halolimnae]TXF85462.1 hypothetical protein FTX54_07650 [Alkalicoccus halolimnae]
MKHTTPLPTFIEFTGIPGSGKTTVAKELIKELRKRGYKVETREEFDFSLENDHFGSSLRIMFGLLKRSNFLFAAKLTGLALFHGHKSLYNLKIIPSFIHSYLKVKKYLADSEADYMIFDQAFFQSLSSIFYNKEIEDPKLLESVAAKIIEELNVKYLISTHLPVEEATKRIIARKHGTSRLDSFESSQISSILQVQSTNFSKIWEAVVGRVSVIKINTENDPSLVRERLIKELNI